MNTGRLESIGALWYRLPLGKDGSAIVWVVLYLAGIRFIAPEELFPANLLALVFAIPLVGPRFASAACLWAFGAFLAYNYPRLFYPAAAAVWLVFVLVNWRKTAGQTVSDRL